MHPITRLRCVYLAFLCLLLPCGLLAGDPPAPPELQLANRYYPGIKLNDYWVSEKLDGVRAYWNGQQLVSKQGHIYHAPDWFLQDLPKFPLDGELWLDRGQFDRLSGIVRKLEPIDEEWALVSYQVFDLPAHTGNFDARLQVLQAYFQEHNTPAWLYLVPQFKVSQAQELNALLDKVVAEKGEGLMLHKGSSHYHAGRDDELLKLKTYDDAEAIVLDHLPGKGKHEGRMGALLVKAVNHQQEDTVFKIGTGFSDQQRADPPPVGEVITYKYFGLTSNGVPRFASFMRVREEG